MMKHRGQRYVQYVNSAYRRSGTLWEGRYRSCLAQSEDYVLACYRYIELNPVRAAMVHHPREYRWSSFHANCDGKRDALITSHEQYLLLARAEFVVCPQWHYLKLPSPACGGRPGWGRNPLCPLPNPPPRYAQGSMGRTMLQVVPLWSVPYWLFFRRRRIS